MWLGRQVLCRTQTTENISKQKCTKPEPSPAVQPTQLWISKCMNLYICLILQIDLRQQLCAYYEPRSRCDASPFVVVTVGTATRPAGRPLTSASKRKCKRKRKRIGQTNSSISSQITSATSSTLYCIGRWLLMLVKLTSRWATTVGPGPKTHWINNFQI